MFRCRWLTAEPLRLATSSLFARAAKEFEGDRLSRELAGSYARRAARGARAALDHAKHACEKHVSLLPDALGEAGASRHVLMQKQRGAVRRCFSLQTAVGRDG
jgi:hypothetical protein